ncbi:MAG: outer membrane protein assembly factor BamD [Bacteroidia bacterium]|nr:outer membrane protein assembly factor BamD [Bacteroidia bacterium]
MKHYGFFIAVAVAASLLAGCKTEYETLLEGNDIDAKYAAAMDYFNMGKYSRSAQLFESLSAVTGGTERDDTVQYYWGLSNYKFKDYYTAETNFANFIINHPLSPLAQDAFYYRIDCLYRNTLRYELDQKPTNQAITAINQYMKQYADSPYETECRNMLTELEERLDRKAFENARLYYKMEDYKASIVAFKNILKDDSENVFREDILYYTAMSSYKYAFMSVPEKQKERYLVFVDDYLNFIGEYPESDYRKELDNLYRKVQKLLGKYPTVLSADEDADEAPVE